MSSARREAADPSRPVSGWQFERRDPLNREAAVLELGLLRRSRSNARGEECVE